MLSGTTHCVVIIKAYTHRYTPLNYRTCNCITPVFQTKANCNNSTDIRDEDEQ